MNRDQSVLTASQARTVARTLGNPGPGRSMTYSDDAIEITEDPAAVALDASGVRVTLRGNRPEPTLVYRVDPNTPDFDPAVFRPGLWTARLAELAGRAVETIEREMRQMAAPPTGLAPDRSNALDTDVFPDIAREAQKTGDAAARLLERGAIPSGADEARFVRLADESKVETFIIKRAGGELSISRSLPHRTGERIALSHATEVYRAPENATDSPTLYIPDNWQNALVERAAAENHGTTAQETTYTIERKVTAWVTASVRATSIAEAARKALTGDDENWEFDYNVAPQSINKNLGILVGDKYVSAVDIATELGVVLATCSLCGEDITPAQQFQKTNDFAHTNPADCPKHPDRAQGTGQ